MNYRKAQMDNHLFKIHHKVKLQLDAICQEVGDMNVEEFMQVYASLKKDVFEKIALEPKNPNVGRIPLTGITRNFQEDMINDMDMGQ
jgi:translation initiation factor 2 alpha subunit (eIF-2alpha)